MQNAGEVECNLFNFTEGDFIVCRGDIKHSLQTFQCNFKFMPDLNYSFARAFCRIDSSREIFVLIHCFMN